MSVVVIGLNHRTAPLDLLERVTIADAARPKALHDLLGRENLSEAVVLSTCNRIEIYAVAERFHGAYGDIRNFLAENAYLAPEDFADHLYVHYDAAAAAHLMAVTSGLDSVVLGEHEIQGQVKQAWERARAEGTAGKLLNLLFRHGLQAGKRARTETSIARSIASVSQAAVAMAEQRLGSLQDRRVLVVGAGEVGEGLAQVLAGAGAAEILVANRTRKRAEDVAARVGGSVVSLYELSDHILEVDVLLTSTGSRTPMVERDDLEGVMAARECKPLLVVDVAMPRDVDPSVGELEGVTLLDMEDLRRFADQGVAARRREVSSVQHILDEELERYSAATSAEAVVPAIVALREWAESIRDAELERFRPRMAYLEPAELEAVEALTRSMVAKLLHEPTVVLKDAAGSSKGERLLVALRELFRMDPGPDMTASEEPSPRAGGGGVGPE